MTVTMTMVIKSNSNAHFWVLRITRFLLIYNKPFYQFKFRILVFKVYRKIFPDSNSQSCDSKMKKGRSMRMRRSISNKLINLLRAKKLKFSMSESRGRYPRLILIIWTISWSSYSILWKLNQYGLGYLYEKDEPANEISL